VRILVIEDDKDVASFIRNGLVQAGCNVDHAANGRDGLFLATTEGYDALVVDRMLPGIDGLTVIRTLRASSNTTPVLILSALGEVDDRVKGLKAGGDDYLVKPFAFSELLARLEALARRAKSAVEAPATVLRAAAGVTMSCSNCARISSTLRNRHRLVTSRAMIVPAPATSATTAVAASVPSMVERSNAAAIHQ